MPSKFARDASAHLKLKASAYRDADSMRLRISPEMREFLESGAAMAFIAAPSSHRWWHRLTGCDCISDREALSRILSHIRERQAGRER